jgi:MerR family redox-sensitive transcriptional activator SoxR
MRSATSSDDSDERLRTHDRGPGLTSPPFGTSTETTGVDWPTFVCASLLRANRSIDAAERVSGQRRYDETVFYRLSIVQRAQQAGFTLHEIQELFTGFVEGTPAPERWKQLSTKKLEELDTQLSQIQFMQSLLREMMDNCHCDTLETCGKGLFRQIGGLSDPEVSNCCSPKR